MGGITRYTGIDAENPIDVSSGNMGRSRVAVASSITTTSADEEVVALFAVDARVQFSTPAGMAEKYDTSNGSSGPSTAEDDALQISASATGDKSSTMSGNRNRNWASQLIALRPSVSVVPGIAFDNSTLGGGLGGSSLTFSHTTNDNTNGLIIVAVEESAPDVCSPDMITSVTYDDVALVDLGYYVGTNAPIGGALKTYYGFAPALGVHDVVVLASAPCLGFAVAVTYTGVKQSSMPDASGVGNPLSNSGTVTDFERTVVTSVPNAWLFMCGVPGGGGTATALSGTTLRHQVTGNLYCGDAGPKVTAGPNTIGWTMTSVPWLANYFSIAPAN